MIDIHCHLSSRYLIGDLNDIISKAYNNGVIKILSVGEDYEDNIRLLDLKAKYPDILIGLGHHPENLSMEDAEKSLGLIEDSYGLLSCIGEIGLDFYKVRDHSERDLQRNIFHLFIETANKYMLPLNIHSRSAGDAVLDTLSNTELSVKVNLHAFSGKAGKAKKAAEEQGFYFSIPGSIFYSSQKQKLARLIPDDYLLLETDSPVMPPVKGQTNYPSNLPIILRELANIRKTDHKDLENILYKNSRNYLMKDYNDNSL